MPLLLHPRFLTMHTGAKLAAISKRRQKFHQGAEAGVGKGMRQVSFEQQESVERVGSLSL